MADAEWVDGLKQGLLLGAAVLVLVMPPARMSLAPAPLSASTAPRLAAPEVPRRLDLGGAPASPEVRRLAQWIVDVNDNGRLSFVILDKKDAQAFVFEPGGTLRGATPVLLGYAPGDDTVAGIGSRPITEVRPEERTTPAGRFVAEPGRNALGEDVLWVDYDAAVSMHRVRLTDPKERRLERLASPTSADNRISYGCINLPVAFFDDVLWPAFRSQRGIVYVLPESKPMHAVFPALPAG